MNGHRYTDATYWRYGTMSMDPSGYASLYHLLPGRLRFLYFRLPWLLLGPYAALWLLRPVHATLATLALATLAAWRLDGWRRVRSFRREVIEPVDAAASAILRSRRDAGQGHNRVNIPADFRDNPDAKVTIRLPLEWVGMDGDKANLVRAVATKLNMDELTPAWSLHGSTPMVSLSKPPSPPDLVDFFDALADADEVSDGAVMIGYGARSKVELFSLLLESPHAIINGGTGAGKSVLLAFIVGQLMRRGYGVLALDAKFVSHMWLRRVPGVHYAAEDHELHDALLWLDSELLRRARYVSKAPDVDAAAASLVPLVVLLEEMTSARNRLDRYWKSIKEAGQPALSPALSALANVANMGRELRVHVLMAGQSLTAKVTGGPEGRESYGARMMARATANAWRMLAPQIKPAPVKRGRPGRWHMVVGDVLKEFQVPFVDLKNEVRPDSVAKLIEWATGGKPIPDVAAMIAGWEPDEATAPSAEVPSSEPVTSLSDYATARGLDLTNLRQWVNRYGQKAGLQHVRTGEKNAKLYRWEDLDSFVAQRLREPVSGAE